MKLNEDEIQKVMIETGMERLQAFRHLQQRIELLQKQHHSLRTMFKIPEGYAVCPCCNGTTRRLLPETSRCYADTLSGYDKTTDTLACNNCGGQTMSLKAVGYTKKPTPEATIGCKHEYEGRNAGNCYTIYHCKICGSSYDIDSGD